MPRIRFQVTGHEDAEIEVFSTRPDTIYGATYMVLAPEHPLVERHHDAGAESGSRDSTLRKTLKKSTIDRAGRRTKRRPACSRALTSCIRLPDKQLPIWIADYVLMDYGTGAIMAVPAHDERDYEFAKAFGLPIVQVIQPEDGSTVEGLYTGPGYAGQLWRSRRPIRTRRQKGGRRTSDRDGTR